MASSRSRLGIALALAVVIAGVMLLTTGGRFAFPLDDPYIYLQYAEQNAQGQLFRYNDGDPTTTGATSALYALVLTPLALVLSGTGLAIGGYVLATVLLALSLDALHALATRWLGPGSARIALALTLLSGPFIWGTFSGMETPLVTFLALRMFLAFDRLRDDPPATRAFTVFASLFACARPECGPLTWLVLGAHVLAARGPGVLGMGRLAIVAGASCLPFVLNLILTGTPSSTTLASKGALFLPGTTLVTWLMTTAQFASHAIKGLFGSGAVGGTGWPSAYTTLVTFAAPLTLLFAVLGAGPAVAREWRERQPGLASGGTIVLCGVLASWAALVPITLHWSRYLLPYLPLLSLFTVAGIESVARGLAARDPGPTDVIPALPPRPDAGDVRRGLVVFFVLASLPTTAFFVAAYAWNAREIDRQHVAMARWIDARTPPGTHVATNDVGAIRYYGHRPVLDLHGLTSRDLAACKQVGSGAVYEFLEALDPGQRPDLLVVIPGWFGSDFLSMHAPVRSQTLRKAMIAGSPLVAYRTDWRLAGSGNVPSPATGAELNARGTGRLMDRLDVADLASEHEHGYALHLEPGESASPVKTLTGPDGAGRSTDGGRLVTGSESFSLRAVPNAPAVLVLRAYGHVRASVQAGAAEPVALDVRASDPDRTWTETFVPIPASAIPTDALSVTIHAVDGALVEGGYLSFHYWLYQ